MFKRRKWTPLDKPSLSNWTTAFHSISRNPTYAASGEELNRLGMLYNVHRRTYFWYIKERDKSYRKRINLAITDWMHGSKS